MKRIVLCADGTWNEPEKKDDETGRPLPSNVLKVARAVKPRSSAGIDQVVYYHEGVGTGGGLDTWTGGAFGRGIEKNVRSLYRFLVFNYEPGDELFFFGFSRGAFTVRTLAGFMKMLGLLEKDDEYYTPVIYGLYERKVSSKSDEWADAFEHIRSMTSSPPIKFVGVWDTVGALGAPGLLGQMVNPKKYQNHDIALHDQIENAYHAVALDERRRPFKASLWERPPGWKGKAFEQVWFPGVHCNVGGGYRPDGLANEALHWMVEKAEGCGLEFDTGYLSYYTPCFNSIKNETLTLFYRALGGPYERPVGLQAGGEERIHQSALDRQALPICDYSPPNLEEYQRRAGTAIRVETTHRVPRGTPCP